MIGDKLINKYIGFCTKLNKNVYIYTREKRLLIINFFKRSINITELIFDTLLIIILCNIIVNTKPSLIYFVYFHGIIIAAGIGYQRIQELIKDFKK